MDFQPLQKRKLFQDIVTQIQKGIENGSLKPGDQLPSERELAERLGVSRTSIREGYRTLECMGCIEIRPGDGVYIKEVTIDDLLKPIKMSVTVNKELLFNLMDFREVIEAEVSRRASVYATEDDLENMRKTLMDAERDIAMGGIGIEQDNDFHLYVAQASQNPFFAMVMNLIGDLLRQSRETTLNIPGEAGRTYNDHKKVFEAIVAGDPEKAASLMREHIVRGKKNIIRIEEEM